ncbi:MFS transporter [Brachybacterium vulturis]|nr:glycoside-pentoside-hexuronide (GPH):cation symporter [Brachybacterium vulturis]
MTAVQDQEKLVRKFGWRDKVGYMFGDFGNDFSFILQAFFFMIFYTNIIGIKPAHVGTLLLLSRILDAFTDIGMGRLVDGSKGTKAGRFRPWILRGAIPVAVASTLMYMPFVGDWESYGARLGWMIVTYILWGSITYTFINIPYGSMASVISDRPADRSQLSVFRSAGAQLAVLFILVVMPLIVYVKIGDDSVLDGQRMMWTAIVMSLFAIIFYLICYALVRERFSVQPPAKEDRPSFLPMIGSVLKNRALLGLLVAALLLLVGSLLGNGLTAYVWLEYFNDGSMQSLAGLFGIVPSFALILLAPWLANKFGKKEVAVVATLISAAALFLAYFLGLQDQPYLFIAILSVSGFMLAVFNFLVWAFIVDVIDYHEITAGQRDDATIYAVYSWARKLGQALAGGLAGWALGWIGYEAVQGGEAVQQTDATIQGIYMLHTLVPGIIYVAVALALIFLYPLSKKRVDENAAKLAARREAADTLND